MDEKKNFNFDLARMFNNIKFVRLSSFFFLSGTQNYTELNNSGTHKS